MQVFAEDGTRIALRVDGRRHRNAVVLLHGFPFSNRVWEAQAAALAERACVLLLDLRGAGKSGAPGGPYLMEGHAADVALALDTLGIERASVVGHSMGGYVALAFARMFTERVERLALISSRLRADTAPEAAARCELADRAEREASIEPIVATYLPRLLAPQTTANRSDAAERAYAIARDNSAAGAAATLRGMALRASSEDIAEDVAVPMLMVAGANDATLPLEEARSDASRFARGHVTICSESGHVPMLEEPDCVTAAISSWLEET